MCAQCGKNWDSGNYCPLCNKCYSDDDFDSKMMQCVQCNHWIHASCQVLYFKAVLFLCVLTKTMQWKTNSKKVKSKCFCIERSGLEPYC